MTARKPLFVASAASVQRWLRALLVCTVFAALQGTLGAWVVPAVSGSPAVEVCTPQGMQWVVLEAGAEAGNPSEGEGSNPSTGSGVPCAWAAARVSVPPRASSLETPLHHPAPLMRPSPALDSGPLARSGIERVLLMAPMRAPPASPT